MSKLELHLKMVRSLFALVVLIGLIAMLAVSAPASAAQASAALPSAPQTHPSRALLTAHPAPQPPAQPEPQPAQLAPRAANRPPQPSAGPTGFSLPATGLLALLVLGGLTGHWAAGRGRRVRPQHKQIARPLLALSLAAVLLNACGLAPATVAPTQPPADYLSRALDWLQANAVKRDGVDWAALRREALARAPNPQTAADTYPALWYATGQLGDWLTFFSDPAQAASNGNYGLLVLYPENRIVVIVPGSSAEKAGLHLGDIVQTVDGAPPRQWQQTPVVDLNPDAARSPKQFSVRRAGAAQPLSFTVSFDTQYKEADPTGHRLAAGAGSVGYIDLPLTNGARQDYATMAQHVLRDDDQPAACGWMVDLRANYSGDIWTYLAAIGPVLGEGEVAGFVYPDGQREAWAYRGGKVYWNDNQRSESLVEGAIYQPQYPQAPVAVLISHATAAAGELAVVAFKGRPGVRTFGEPTAGSPFLQATTSLSDGAFLSVSGAYGVDRTGQTYDGPIAPDEPVTVDWALYGASQDPVITAAQAWLATQPGCAN